MRARSGCWLLTVALASVGCSRAAEGSGEVGATRAEVVYGADDRIEIYASGDARHRELAAATVMLVEADALDASDPEDVWLLAYDLATTTGLCVDERFARQPAPGFCSGVLVGEDLVLTAGHCVEDGWCGQTRLVFDYHYRADGELEPISVAEDVYSCAEVLVFRNEYVGPAGEEESYDHAIIRLDRPVTGDRRPVQVARSLTPLAVGTPLLTISYPEGIPAKIDAGGSVYDGRAGVLDYFVSNHDISSGSSGAPVFDASGTVVGIIVAGEWSDYVDAGSCLRHYELDDGAAGTWSSYAALAVEELCATGSDATLCRPPEPDAGPVGAPDAGTGTPGPDAGPTGEGRDGCAIGQHAVGRRPSGLAWLAPLAALLALRRRRRA